MANYWLEMRFYNAMLLQDIEKKTDKGSKHFKDRCYIIHINVHQYLYHTVFL